MAATRSCCAHHLGNRHPLRPQAFRHAHAPFTPDDCARQRGLCQHPPRRHVHAVVLVVDAQVQSQIRRPVHCFRYGEPLQVRNLHLRAMNREVHRRHCRDQVGHSERQPGEDQAEEIDHAGCTVGDDVIDGFAAFSSILETEQYLFFDSATASSAALAETSPLR